MTDPNLRVLVVDDDPTIRELMATLLGFEGWQVDVAADGSDALAAADRVRPDVVLVDATMPGLSGYEVCRRLKERDTPPRVIMVTGKTLQRDQLDARAAGADAFISKPFSPVELLDAVTRES